MDGNQLAVRTRLAWAWRCTTCDRECVPVRAESRCLCGHRLKNHETDTHRCGMACIEQSEAAVMMLTAAGCTPPRRCEAPGCRCLRFFYIVAEGAWVLRCRCKHKHTEHDAESHSCSRRGCCCTAFHSPWVCNCDHGWAAHEQVLVERRVLSLSAAAAAAAEARAPHTDAILSQAAAHSRVPLLQQQQHHHHHCSAGVSVFTSAQAHTDASSSRRGDGDADVEVLLAELSCDVNRWDLVQRGKSLPED